MIIILQNKRHGEKYISLTGSIHDHSLEVNCESLKSVMPARPSYGQTLFFFDNHHATRVNELKELDSKATKEQDYR